MIITLATAADLPGLMALEEDGFSDRRWSRRAWTDELESSRSHVFVARDGGRTAGVITLSVAADVADVDRVVVATTDRGQGVGRSLLEWGVGQVQTAGVGRVLLEVEEGNAAARALYASAGFAPIGARRGYYGPGRDAIVMERRIGEENQP